VVTTAALGSSLPICKAFRDARVERRSSDPLRRRVHVLRVGHEMSDKAAMTLLKDAGKIVEVPYHSYLIESSDGLVLVDTGSSVRWREVHPQQLVEYWPVMLKEEEHLDRMLKRELGFSVDDVHYVINTHLHYDHCGNNEMFQNAKFLVSEAEFAHAMAPGWWEALPYVRAVFDKPKLKYQVIRGNHEVLPGVELIPTPGHTEGHQSVVIQLEESGPLILAGDAIYFRENLETPILPGVYVDARRYAESADRLKSLVDTRRGTLLLSHWREYLTPQGWFPLKEGVHTFE
jgi:glyoxylase-like metal-dependent hydrolase (beta-lactamase superfamily II)